MADCFQLVAILVFVFAAGFLLSDVPLIYTYWQSFQNTEKLAIDYMFI